MQVIGNSMARFTAIIGFSSLLFSCNTVVDSSDRSGAMTTLSRSDHSLYFPIETGIHSGIDCITCHGDYDTFRQFTCLNCHEHDQSPMNGSHSNVTDYTWDSPSCYACHPVGTVDGVGMNHNDFFPIDSGIHASISCSTCHNVPDNYQEFTCLSCHEHDQNPMDNSHNDVDGYVWASESCYACHPAGSIDGAGIDHSGIFPIAPGDVHSNVTCSECHTNGTTSVADCSTCHIAIQSGTSSEHSAVRDFSTASSMCKKCHADSDVLLRTQHRPFVITSGDHRSSKCLDCHPYVRSDKVWGADFSQSMCLDCHSENSLWGDHFYRPNYAYENSKCLECHPDGKD